MPRQYEIYLRDILKALEKVQSYVEDRDKNTFSDDNLRVDAVLHNLIIIGEAAKHIPDNIRDKINAIEWRKIAGFRDIAVHQYFKVNIDIVWDIIQNHLPVLKQQIENFLNEQPDNEDTP